jgi:hypothetical protein
MRRLVVLAVPLALATPTPAAAEPVPDSIHSLGGPDDKICGLRSGDIPALEAQLARDLPREAGNERYRAYWDEAARRIWTFTTAVHPAHPAVACRTIGERDGAVYVDTEITCYSTRANCDALYREFEQLNAEMRRALARGR